MRAFLEGCTISRSMGSVVMDHAETGTMESMAEMADRMSKELRAEMHSAEVQLNNWVAEREQRLADIQVSQASPCSLEGGLGVFLVAVDVLLLW